MKLQGTCPLSFTRSGKTPPKRESISSLNNNDRPLNDYTIDSIQHITVQKQRYIYSLISVTNMNQSISAMIHKYHVLQNRLPTQRSTRSQKQDSPAGATKMRFSVDEPQMTMGLANAIAIVLQCISVAFQKDPKS